MELLRTFGVEVIQVRTASIANPRHYINVAARVASERPGAVFMDQFETMANFEAHFANTGPEIWEQSGGRCVLVTSIRSPMFLTVCRRHGSGGERDEFAKFSSCVMLECQMSGFEDSQLLLLSLPCSTWNHSLALYVS